MKLTTKLSILMMSFSILLLGCIKNQTKSGRSSSSGIIAEAQLYFNQIVLDASKSANSRNYRANQPRSLCWDQATIQQLLNV
jgi:hypothetical protein